METNQRFTLQILAGINSYAASRSTLLSAFPPLRLRAQSTAPAAGNLLSLAHTIWGMGRTKKHHFLAQGYLRNFSYQGARTRIYQLEKAGDRASLISIEDAGCKADFHTIDKGGGVKDSHSIEQQLSKLESMHLDVVRRIIHAQTLKDIDHQRLCEFIGLMQFRVPSMKAHIDAMVTSTAKAMNEMLAVGNRFEQTAERLDAPELQKYPPHIRKVICDRIRRMINNEEYDIEVSNAALLSHMFGVAFDPQLLRVLMSMGWAILQAAGGHSFVTSDQPVAIYDDQGRPGQQMGRPMMAPGMEVTLPLGAHTLVRLDSSRHKGARIQLTAAETEEMNRRTIIMADRFIFSPQVDESLKLLMRANANNRAGMTNSVVTMKPGDKYLCIGGRISVCPAHRYNNSQEA